MRSDNPTTASVSNMNRKTRPKRGLRPTYASVKFGPRERNLMSVWLAESDRPTPVLLTFHAGGFRSRPEGPPPESFEFVAVKLEILRLLGAGISIVAPSHDGTGATPFEDALRANFGATTQWNVMALVA